ncbi:MAG: cytochrome c [Methylocystaceae bacterium]|nr:cytochrome c [Methylocystaceae bacterium]
MKKLLLAACVTVATGMGISYSYEAVAAENNPAIVHRQSTYQVVAGHMGSLKSILFLGGSGDAAYHAGAIKSAFEHMGNAYPAGSDKGETKAKAEIWEDMDGFKQKGKEAYGATLKLVEATAGDDKGAQIEAFKALGGACKACHKNYRAK